MLLFLGSLILSLVFTYILFFIFGHEPEEQSDIGLSEETTAGSGVETKNDQQ